MRKFPLVLVLAALAAPTAFAATSQEKAQSCKEAADKQGLKDDQLRNFMRKCTSAGSQRVETCRQVANDKSLTAEQRKNLMSKCR